MVGSSWIQTWALCRKNLVYHKRHLRSNVWIVLVPAIIFLFLGVLRHYSAIKGLENQDELPYVEFYPLMEVPENEFRAVRTGVMPAFSDLPDESCREKGSCPVTVLLTGHDQAFGQSMAGYMFPKISNQNSSSDVTEIVDGVYGMSLNEYSYESQLYRIQSECSVNTTYENVGESKIKCVRGLPLWRENHKEINEELFRGYMNGNSKGQINQILAAFDFINSSKKNLRVDMWYNSTYRSTGINAEERPTTKVPKIMHIQGALNMIWNAYLRLLLGPSVKMGLEFVGEMVIPEHTAFEDIASEYGAYFFMWILLQLFPVMVSLLVYEKEQKLRMMMKMHGLGEFSYRLNTYIYFLFVSSIYMVCVVGFGSLTGLPIFRLNSYRVQCVYYIVHINLMISSAFLFSAFFSNAKSASVGSYMIVFGIWILGARVFQPLIEDTSFPRVWLIILELFPGFSVQRGLYEFSKYGATAFDMGTYGMRWQQFLSHSSSTGLKEIMIIMSLECLIFLSLGYYVDQALFPGTGSSRNPLSIFFPSSRKPPSSSSYTRRPGSHQVLVRMDKFDVDQEIEKVEDILHEEPDGNYPIICYNLRKTYPRQGGNPGKLAVKGLSLAVSRGECFGLLGPNGSGKTSFISMMTGLIKPSSGTAYIQGLDLRTQMKMIHASMGVCPQDNLLWDSLTGKEHLYFYGRLKNLRGQTLKQEVEERLRSVDLLQEENANKVAGKYSGGMKRRLSVAISLIGNPKVVYMDEPSTGLDPASKDKLWDAINKSKQDRAIILTTHSLEEAEHLCDRIGILINGELQCIGSPDEIKERYGGTYIFTMITSPEHEGNVQALVNRLSPNAKKIQHIAGTQKFELSKNEVKISKVFWAVMNAKKRFSVQAWEISETTLEDAFVKVANGAEEESIMQNM